MENLLRVSHQMLFRASPRSCDDKVDESVRARFEMQAQELRANDGMSLFPLQGQFFVSLRVVDNEWLIGQHLAQRGEIDHAMAVNVHLGVFTPPGR